MMGLVTEFCKEALMKKNYNKPMKWFWLDHECNNFKVSKRGFNTH